MRSAKRGREARRAGDQDLLLRGIEPTTTGIDGNRKSIARTQHAHNNEEYTRALVI